MFRIYRLEIEINAVHYGEVWIDPHYEEKHKGSIHDELILKLVDSLRGKIIDEVGRLHNGYKFYEVDLIFNNKNYRLILTTPRDNSFLGVRNVYRRSK